MSPSVQLKPPFCKCRWSTDDFLWAACFRCFLLNAAVTWHGHSTFSWKSRWDHQVALCQCLLSTGAASERDLLGDVCCVRHLSEGSKNFTHPFQSFLKCQFFCRWKAFIPTFPVKEHMKILGRCLQISKTGFQKLLCWCLSDKSGHCGFQMGTVSNWKGFLAWSVWCSSNWRLLRSGFRIMVTSFERIT